MDLDRGAFRCLSSGVTRRAARTGRRAPAFGCGWAPQCGEIFLINALIGEDRYIVTDVAGTTRDSIDTVYNQFGFEFKLVDTAGIRRKSKVKESIEFYSVMRSVRAIEHSDVCLLVVDATRGFDGQVQKIFFGWLTGTIKGIVILVNKWDLIAKDTATLRQFEKSDKRKNCSIYGCSHSVYLCRK